MAGFRSIDRLSPETGERKKINMQASHQNSARGNYTFARYPEKLFTKIYRDFCGDASIFPFVNKRCHFRDSWKNF